MASHLVLGIRLTPNSFQRVKIDGVNLDDKSELLKLEASKTTNLPSNSLELVYCGNIMDDEATLSSYGLKSGVMVHVLKKKDKEMPLPVKSMTEGEIQELVRAFRTFTRHPSYRSALHRLSRPEVLENIIASTAGLSDDPVAAAIIQDPELLVHMENADTVRRIAELHPSLAEAASQIAAAVHEEAAAGTSANQGTSSGYSYSLDALSDDDEEMESSQPRGEGLFRMQSQSSITAAQLATALAAASGFFPSLPRPSGSGAAAAATTAATRLGAASGGGGAGNIITSEMFSHAMQQAIANSTSNAASQQSTAAPTAAAAAASDLGEIERRLNRQVLQMRELGLTDNAINLQALRATGGDLQAAIDLVFSGTFSPDAE